MWMRLSNGREELIVNEDHVKRLLGEGAIEIADPRVPQAPETPQEPEQPQVPSGETGSEQTQAPESEQPDGSTNVDGEPDSTGQGDDQRSEPGTGHDGDTVQRPADTGQTRRKSR